MGATDKVQVQRFTIMLGVALALAAAGPAQGAEAVLTLVAPPQVQPGSVVEIDLVGLNPGFGEPMRFDPGAALPATFKTATGTFPVTLAAASDAATSVEPRGFGVRTYSLTIPDPPEGDATLSVAAGGGEIAAAMRVARDGAAEAHHRLASAPAQTFPRTLPGRLAIHQPNYFVYGAGNEPAAKFQLSLKYRLLTFGDGTPEHPRPTFQLAYTQRSLWDLKAPSKPFYDTSYMPEGFVEYVSPPDEYPRTMSLLGWAAGYRHESNGKDGAGSRAYDVLFARTHVAFGSAHAWYLVVTPEIWQYIGTLGENSQVKEYRGHGRVSFAAGRGSGASLVWSVTPEHSFEHFTHQLDLSLPVGLRKLDFATYLVVQYFDGYAESLLDYTHESRSVRVGLSLVR